MQHENVQKKDTKSDGMKPLILSMGVCDETEYKNANINFPFHIASAQHERPLYIVVPPSQPSEHTSEREGARPCGRVCNTTHFLPDGVAATTMSSAAACIIIDPASTGAVLAHTVASDFPDTLSMVCVWSDVIPDGIKQHVQQGLEVQYVAVVQHVAGELASTVAQVRALGLDVCSVMVGCETGVNLNDELCDALGLVGNSIAHTALRR
jgi:hypothetical protein